MPAVLLDGYTLDEALALPNEDLQAMVLRDEPLVFRAGEWYWSRVPVGP